jgi:hypothetical protein
VYNVPNAAFNHAEYTADMREVLVHLFNGTLPGGGSGDWLEVNELRYLISEGQSWTASQIHDVVDAAWEELGLE